MTDWQFLEMCEKIKKEFQKLFWQHGLKLIIKCNLKIVDFLDVTLNLNRLYIQALPNFNNETTADLYWNKTF